MSQNKLGPIQILFLTSWLGRHALSEKGGQHGAY